MAAITTQRFVAKLGELCDPVALGQTRGGLVLAAVLIAGWQLTATTYGQSASGFSENDYFRLEWEYELAEGTGTIEMTGVGEWAWCGLAGILDQGRFTTAGVTFDSAAWSMGPSDEDPFGPPTYQGDEEGRPVFEYDLLNPILFVEGSSVQIDLTFPTEGVELRATEFSYEGYTAMSAAGGPVVPIPPGELPFASIQMIPEPAACATLGLGAAALAAALRRRDRA